MYAIKGGWVGQTFALATSNESGGRKARIRRSKEERKAMVESFIKKYQSTNDGKFPSLNLTHKEVGGSFYTVREIVRDIIQENRVLGPAKFGLQEQKFDGTTSVYFPGSTLVESQGYLFQLGNENPAVLNSQASGNIGLNVNGDLTCAENYLLDAGEFVSRSAKEKSDGSVCAESLPTKNLEDNEEPDFVDSRTNHHGNLSMELNLHEYRQPIEHEHLTPEQFVNGSQIGDPCEELCTKSLVGEDMEVRMESGLSLRTEMQEKGELELRFSDDEQRNEHEGLDVGNFVNSSQIDESDDFICVESSLDERHDTNINPGSVEASAAELINPGEDVAVETLPSQPVKDTYTSDLVSNNRRDSSVDTKKLESSCVESGNDGTVLDRLDVFVSGSEVVVEKAVNDPEVASSNEEHGIHETARNNVSNLQEVEDLSKGGETTPCYNDPIVTLHNEMASSKMVDETQRMTRVGARDDHSSNPTNNLNGANTGGGGNSSRVELITGKQVMSGSLNGVQEKDAALKESRATLDRINLESWEGAPKKFLDQEGNPLVAVFRALVSAFMKIFSE